MKKPDAINEIRIEGGTIFLSGSLRRGGQPDLLRVMMRHLQRMPVGEVEIDLSGITHLDSLGASALGEIEAQAAKAGIAVKFVQSSPETAAGLARYSGVSSETPPEIREHQGLEKLGGGAYELLEAAGTLLLLVSDSIYWSLVALWNPRGHRKGAVAAQALSIGVGALPVVAVIAFLIGVVLTLQSAAQLRQFGANIFVADLLVISMTREMGPLMTAILLAGRSGAAIAAEISSMTVNEETDALVVMGLKPIRYVVAPKILGILITAPMLSILATTVGIFGGFLVAINSLDLTPQSFLLEAQNALYLKDIITGLVKMCVFAFIIVILAAFYGFRVTGGPEGVGKATTKAVVAAIFGVIVADSVLGLLFYL